MKQALGLKGKYFNFENAFNVFFISLFFKVRQTFSIGLFHFSAVFWESLLQGVGGHLISKTTAVSTW